MGALTAAADADPTTTLWLAGELGRLVSDGERPVDAAERIVTHLTAARALVDPSTAVSLWRCTACGKWSHAKRRPKQHQRGVKTGTVTVAEQEPDTGAWVDVEVDDWDYVPCGPFEAWTATRSPAVP